MFGGPKKDNAVALNSDNIFAALERRKKKGSKNKDNVEALKKSTEFWTKAPLNVKSWADCEDDDDFYATAAPPVWSNDQPREKESDKEESEDQEDYDIEEDVDEETDEKENDTKLSEVVPSVGPSLLQVNKSREPEKQLSKKEIKKKELAELDKVLEEFGLLTKERNDVICSTKDPEHEVHRSSSDGIVIAKRCCYRPVGKLLLHCCYRDVGKLPIQLYCSLTSSIFFADLSFGRCTTAVIPVR